MAVLLAVMSDVARRRGRAIEPSFIQRMGGLPSITMMRYGDGTFDQASKAAMHKFLAGKIAGKPPTPEDEKADPCVADGFYKRANDWLRENTRDTKKFKILFEENVTYGFRRNLLGLKWLALALDAAIVFICLSMLYSRFPLNTDNSLTQKLLTVLVITFVHAAYVLVFVNEAGVAEAARTYGRQLLLCTVTISQRAPPKAVRKKKV